MSDSEKARLRGLVAEVNERAPRAMEVLRLMDGEHTLLGIMQELLLSEEEMGECVDALADAGFAQPVSMH